MSLINNYPPIIALHYVSNDTSLNDLRPWVISHESFIRLLDYLERVGYSTLTFEDLIYGEPRLRKSVIITFDDCPRHLWDFAIPELIRRNMKAVFYIPTAYIGGYNEWNVSEGHSRVDLMSEIEIQRLVDAGMEVGSHSHHHVMLSQQTSMYVTSELTKSKIILENIIKKKVLSIAYPYGEVPYDYKTIACQLKIHAALSVYTAYDSKYAVRRFIYDDTDTDETLRWKLSALYKLYRFFNDKISIVSKRYAQHIYKVYSSLKHKFMAYIGMICLGLEDVLITL